MKKSSLIALACFALAAFAGATVQAAEFKVTLSGDNEVPPVKTAASAQGTIIVAADGAVSGSIATKGIDGTMAHIHMAAVGKNGPVVVKLTKDGDTFKVPADAKLDATQLAALKAGDLYVNVHSAANKSGELRAQLN